jgi:hypothetical protein
VKDLPAGQYGVQAVSGDLVSGVSDGILVRSGTEAEGVTLVVSQGAQVRVTVRDTGGSVLENVNVSAGRLLPGSGFRFEGWARTDKEGLAVLSALQEGEWSISAQYQGRLQESRTVNLGGGVSLDLELRLREGGTLVIHVRDGDGRPVPDAIVSLVDAATGTAIPVDWSRIWSDLQSRSPGGRVDWQRAQRLAQYTDEQGVHVRAGLPPGEVRVFVNRQGFPRSETTAHALDGFEVDHHVVLENPPPEGGDEGDGDDDE